MREAKQYYDQAFANAWSAILEKLQTHKQQIKGSDFRLERIDYDADSYISRIDELPDEPKAPSADLLEVKIDRPAAGHTQSLLSRFDGVHLLFNFSGRDQHQGKRYSGFFIQVTLTKSTALHDSHG